MRAIFAIAINFELLLTVANHFCGSEIVAASVTSPSGHKCSHSSYAKRTLAQPGVTSVDPPQLASCVAALVDRFNAVQSCKFTFPSGYFQSKPNGFARLKVGHRCLLAAVLSCQSRPLILSEVTFNGLAR